MASTSLPTNRARRARPAAPPARASTPQPIPNSAPFIFPQPATPPTQPLAFTITQPTAPTTQPATPFTPSTAPYTQPTGVRAEVCAVGGCRATKGRLSGKCSRAMCRDHCIQAGGCRTRRHKGSAPAPAALLPTAPMSPAPAQPPFPRLALPPYIIRMPNSDEDPPLELDEAELAELQDDPMAESDDTAPRIVSGTNITLEHLPRTQDPLELDKAELAELQDDPMAELDDTAPRIASGSNVTLEDLPRTQDQPALHNYPSSLLMPVPPATPAPSQVRPPTQGQQSGASQQNTYVAAAEKWFGPGRMKAGGTKPRFTTQMNDTWMKSHRASIQQRSAEETALANLREQQRQLKERFSLMVWLKVCPCIVRPAYRAESCRHVEW
ncbi:hypothetical protein FA95DRAFT_355605 [Auriscalpium vulgare]|uniref:Uncharacterized protein n=1 Tax=Auriscalpium vulgare TaxID=40419 RepID=A0ACB8S406_9AGAM|nr:hypothetical protein FA95DRAFT_355605 [Auriscalpium vulgare]